MKKHGLRLAISFLLLSVLGLVCYGNVLNTFFLSDDFDILWGVQIAGAFVLGMRGNTFFRPMNSVSMYLDRQIWGLNHVGYHLTNTMLHVFNALLVGLIVDLLIRRVDPVSLKERDRQWMAYLAGIFYLVLPCHAEAVSWISSRFDLLAAHFCLLSFSCYLVYKQGDRRFVWLGISLLMYACGLLSKEAAATYPFIIVIYELCETIFFRQRLLWRSVVLSFSYGVLLAVYLVIRTRQVGDVVGGYGAQVHLDFSLERTFEHLVFFAGRAWLPPLSKVNFGFWCLAAIIPILMAVIYGIRCWRTGDRPMFGVLLFLMGAFPVALLPALSLGVSTANTQNERFLYFPSTFTAMLLAIALMGCITEFITSLCVALAVVIFWSIPLYAINQHWVVAGNISQQVLQSLAPYLSSEKIVIASLPDSYQGVYIYRNGIYNAINLFLSPQQIVVPGSSTGIRAIAFQTILEKDDGSLVEPLTSNRYHVSLSNQSTEFITFTPTPSSPVENEMFVVQNFTGKSYDLNLRNFQTGDRLLYYSAGKLIHLER